MANLWLLAIAGFLAVAIGLSMVIWANRGEKMHQQQYQRTPLSTNGVVALCTMLFVLGIIFGSVIGYIVIKSQMSQMCLEAIFGG